MFLALDEDEVVPFVFPFTKSLGGECILDLGLCNELVGDRGSPSLRDEIAVNGTAGQADCNS